MRALFPGLLGLVLSTLFSANCLAVTQLLFEPQVATLTTVETATADKARVIRLSDGTLIVAWIEGVGSPDRSWRFDGVAGPARDIFMRTSSDGGATWTETVNISGTAGLTDPGVLYDRVGNTAGLANFYGDSGKATIMAFANDVLVIWNDTYCGAGRHGPARYESPLGFIEVPYRCLYAARLKVSVEGVTVIAVDRLTDATRDVTNEVARATGAGFAIAWQADPFGLQLGEARGEGDGSSGARVSRGTDIWYAWMPRSGFADPGRAWAGPTVVSDNWDFDANVATSGGASRPNMVMAGSPPTAIIVYEEAKSAGSTDVGKSVRYHAFPFNQPPGAEAGVIVSNPAENARRARVLAMTTPGAVHGTRVLVMWRQGLGIQGAPADFMMRVGHVPEGTDLGQVPDAGFRIADLWPPVDPDDPAGNASPLNLSADSLDEPTSLNPIANAKAHRAVMDGDFIYAGYTRDEDATDGVNRYQYFLRSSADGGMSWAPPLQVSAGVPGSENVIEPRLLRTPGTVPSGNPYDVRDPDIYIMAWGTEVDPGDGLEPYRDAIFVTRSVDRGQSIERVQVISETRTSPGQTDEQMQLRVTPDGQNVWATWIRQGAEGSKVVFARAVGIIPTADLSVTMSSSDHAPDVGDAFELALEVGNGGPRPATELYLSLTVGEGLLVTGASTAHGNCEVGATVECALDDLPLGQTAGVAVSLEVESRGSSLVSAAVSSWEEDFETADNTAQVTINGIPHADLAAAFTTDAEGLKVGDDFNVSFEALNHGPQDATGVVAIFTLPSSVDLNGGHDCNLVGRQLTCAAPDIASGEDWDKTLSLKATGSGVAIILVSAITSEDDPVPTNNESRVSVFVEAVVDDGSSGGGCVYAPAGQSGHTLVLLLMLSLAWRIHRHLRSSREAHAGP